MSIYDPQDLFIDEALQAHNDYRKLHGVPKLIHNPELSYIALKWAINISQKNMIRQSKSSYKGKNLGQNVALWFVPGADKFSGRVATKQWYDEITDYNFTDPKFSFKTGNFSQLVWRDTKEVGFGVAQASNGYFYGVACYFPAGNIASVYEFKRNVLPPQTKSSLARSQSLPKISISPTKQLTSKSRLSTINEDPASSDGLSMTLNLPKGDKVNINLKMGNCKVKSPSPSSPESPRVRYIKPLPEEHMQGLMDNTNMSRNEIKMWYEGFMNDCPDGRLKKSKFLKIYHELFPNCKSNAFSERLFDIIDKDHSGYVDFYEFITCCSILCYSDITEKLKLIFEVYDIDSDGYMSRSEIQRVLESVMDLQGIDYDKKEVLRKTNFIIKRFDKDNDEIISKSEFLLGVMGDPDLVKTLNNFN